MQGEKKNRKKEKGSGQGGLFLRLWTDDGQGAASIGDLVAPFRFSLAAENAKSAKLVVLNRYATDNLRTRGGGLWNVEWYCGKESFCWTFLRQTPTCMTIGEVQDTNLN